MESGMSPLNISPNLSPIPLSLLLSRYFLCLVHSIKRAKVALKNVLPNRIFHF
jgi:hypothetical protein